MIPVEAVMKVPKMKELLLLLDLDVAVVKGMITDGILLYGYDVINDHDLRQWLLKRGASKMTVYSHIMKLHYDYLVSYRDGDITKPDFEAGTALRGYLFTYLCYENAPTYKMQAGMGDVVFAPMFQVLQKRGVKFRFFHKVEELILNPNDQKLVEEITITKQVDLSNGEYKPLIDVKGLPSWPNEPKYEEIVEDQARLLQDNNVDLESFWTDWPTIYQRHFKEPAPEITLKRGQDFDMVVYGISIASLPFLCPQLMEASPTLRSTQEHVGTTVTQHLQLWFDVPLAELKYSPAIDWHPIYMHQIYDHILLSEVWNDIKLQPKVTTPTFQLSAKCKQNLTQ